MKINQLTIPTSHATAEGAKRPKPALARLIMGRVSVAMAATLGLVSAAFCARDAAGVQTEPVITQGAVPHTTRLTVIDLEYPGVSVDNCDPFLTFEIRLPNGELVPWDRIWYRRSDSFWTAGLDWHEIQLVNGVATVWNPGAFLGSPIEPISDWWQLHFGTEAGDRAHGIVEIFLTNGDGCSW